MKEKASPSLMIEYPYEVQGSSLSEGVVMILM